jgi:hypothetical protein
MTTITQRRKKSIWLWVLIFLAFASLIAVAVLSYLGYIDLTPVSNSILSAFIWASESIVNAGLLGGGFIALGVLGYYILVKYFIGSKVTTNLPTYQPQGQTLSQNPSASKDETVIN